MVPPLPKELSRIPYDIEYALRLCSEHHMTHACVHIYCVKELYEEAMDLSLKVGGVQGQGAVCVWQFGIAQT